MGAGASRHGTRVEQIGAEPANRGDDVGGVHSVVATEPPDVAAKPPPAAAEPPVVAIARARRPPPVTVSTAAVAGADAIKLVPASPWKGRGARSNPRLRLSPRLRPSLSPRPQTSPRPSGSPNESGLSPQRKRFNRLAETVSARAATTAEAARGVSGAAADTLVTLFEAMAGGLRKLTVVQIKLQLGRSLSCAAPMDEPMTPGEVKTCIADLGLRGEVNVLSEVLERHHGHRVTRQSLLAGLVAVALGSFGDKVSMLFVIFDESMDGRLQLAELERLFFACCAFKPRLEYGAGSELQPVALAAECIGLCGHGEDGVTLPAFFDFCKLHQAKLQPLLTLETAQRRVTSTAPRLAPLDCRALETLELGALRESSSTSSPERGGGRGRRPYGVSAPARSGTMQPRKDASASSLAPIEHRNARFGAGRLRGGDGDGGETGPTREWSGHEFNPVARADSARADVPSTRVAGGAMQTEVIVAPARQLAPVKRSRILGRASTAKPDEADARAGDARAAPAGPAAAGSARYAPDGGAWRRATLSVVVPTSAARASAAAPTLPSLQPLLRQHAAERAAAERASPQADDLSSEVLGGFASTEIFDLAGTITNTNKRVGSGGFADVYEAAWLGTPVALKLIKGATNHVVDSRTLLALKREVRVLERVRHPNCIMLLGWSQEPLAVVTELYSGAAISAQLAELGARARSLGADGSPLLGEAAYSLRADGHARWALAVARDVARGMVYLHHLSIIHRDLKSANLLADRPLVPAELAAGRPTSGRVRIADFGLSRAIAGTVGLEDMVGSIPWMAPEVMTSSGQGGGLRSRGSYGIEVDVFSYGVVLWELATAEPPYSALLAGKAGQKGMHLVGVLYKVAKEGLRPEPPTEGALAEAGLSALMAECWVAEPGKRPTFTSILARLDAIEVALDASAHGDGGEAEPLATVRSYKSMPYDYKSMQQSSTATGSFRK